MNFEISIEAAKWYKKELKLKQGDFVQFYVQLYGGISAFRPKHSLGVSIGKEGKITIEKEVEGITFYFNDENSWFLDEFDVKVVIENDELEFIFNEKQG